LTNPVNRVGRSVCLDVVAGRLHYSSNDNQEQHEKEPLNTTPNIENFSDEEVANTTCDGGDNAHNSGKAMLAKIGRNVGIQIGLDGGQQGLDELRKV